MEGSMKEITNNRILDLLCCAYEGGSNYWASVVSVTPPPELELDSPELNQDFLYPSLTSPVFGGFTIISTPDSTGETLDRKAIEEALFLMKEKYPFHWNSFINMEEDADTGDVFLQLCLFKEIVYG